MTKQLRKSQKELIDSFVLDTEKINTIMKTYIKNMKGFHNYSIGNLILANYQLTQRTGETIDILASYKKWSEKDRHVKKGEKCLYVLAPIVKEIKDDEGEVIEKQMFFRRVPVFDISQTDGETFQEDYTINNGDLTFEDILSKSPVEVVESKKVLTKGYTDGKKIWISETLSDTQKICVYFHEYAHCLLHFNEEDEEKSIKELEAESVAYMVASAMGIQNDESSAYIKNWASENSQSEIKGRGSKLIQTASKIINSLQLNDNLVEA